MGEKHTNNNKNLHEILKQHFVYNLNSNWKKNLIRNGRRLAQN